MKDEAKVLIGIGLATLIILAGGVFFLSKTNNSSTSSPEEVDAKLLVKDDSNRIGTESAKVTLVEFGDFQCPSCAAAHPIVKQILQDYKNKIFFVFRNFPLPMHKNAQIAAEAAEGAGAIGGQKKYWEMHDKLFENQNEWAENNKPLDLFIEYSKELELDTDKFKKAVEQNKFQGKIQKDINDGNSIGVNGTPTFFVNGKKVKITDLKSTIDSELK
jgi:protein-disulfide isomerase